MIIEKIEKLLDRCDLEELEQVIIAATEKRDKARLGRSQMSEDDARQRRGEPRFETNLLATLTRITDVKPGERKEYSVTIRDISRSGMKLTVDTNFVPSRVVEVTFAGPGGKIKRTMLEIVRMRKMLNDDGSWIEVGCRAIGDEHVRRIRLQEEKIIKMRGKLHKKSGVTVLVVGPEKSEIVQIIARLKSASYQVRHITGLRQAMQSAAKTGAQLALLCQGSELAHDAKLRAELDDAPGHLAMLAVVDNDEDRFILLESGVDEVMTLGPVVEDDFLFYCMERAMVGHVVRRRDRHGPTALGLVISLDQTKINLISYQLEDHGYGVRVVEEAADALRFTSDEFDLVLADFDAMSSEDFEQIVRHFCTLPVVALCDEIGYGHEAMSKGAANYLTMPPGRDEMRMILQGVNTGA